MVDVVLIYPFFRPQHDRSIFRFPPLGLGYIASYLRAHNISAEMIDCTFITKEEALRRARSHDPSVIGIYTMYTMEENSLQFAKSLRDDCDLLVAGGPLPSVFPEKFLHDFDIVAIGEGEQTMLDVTLASNNGHGLTAISGIAHNGAHRVTGTDEPTNSSIVRNPQRAFIENLDTLPLPARDLFDNQAYQEYYKKTFGQAVTSVMTSRGCPYKCDFCSKPVFGDVFRARSAANVVDEIEDVLSYGYESVFFQDDCFTLDERRVFNICEEILRRGLKLNWECLSRVDAINLDLLSKMKQAGCRRVFFGIESGNNDVLKIMNKQLTIEQAKRAVELTASSGLKTGAFFILGYPGETDRTVLETIRFATSLPLNYLSFTLPYPIPGTGLYEKVKDRLNSKNPNSAAPKRHQLIDHSLNFECDFSERKLKMAIAKATIQFRIRRYLGRSLYLLIGKPFEILTDVIFKALS